MHLLTALAAFFAVAATLFVAVLVARRVWVARGVRRRAEAETRVQPLALALLDGEPDAVTDDLGDDDARALARVLTRLGRHLSAGARANAAAFFVERGYVAEERRRLRARRAWRRATAAAALGDMGATEAIGDLLSRLADHDSDVRASAARALGRLGAVEAAAPLVRSLASGYVPRASAGQALLNIGPAAVEQLGPLTTAEDAGVRAAAIEIVGLVGSAEDADRVRRHLRDGAAEVRARACRALGRLGAGESAGELRAALGDRIPFVRAAAASALGQLGDREAVLLLARQAHRDTFDPAQAAARALLRIAPDATVRAALAPGAGPHLLEAADRATMELAA